MNAVVRAINRHRDDILARFDSHITNGLIEGVCNLVHAAKAKATGYRNSKTLKDVTYMVSGNLDFRLPI
jgi:transposase